MSKPVPGRPVTSVPDAEKPPHTTTADVPPPQGNSSAAGQGVDEPAGGPSLQAVIQRAIEEVDQRVEAASDVHVTDRQEVRRAATEVERIRSTLGLSRFLGWVGPASGKPQFRLLFDHPQHGLVVLKVYGRSRPGEALVQRLWQHNGIPAVGVLSAGDAPITWLLMPYQELAPLSQGPLAGESLVAVTKQLAAIMARAHPLGMGALTEAAGAFRNLHHLDEAIGKHLGDVMTVVQQHGYQVREDWQVLTRQLCGARNATLLHGDLVAGNVLRATDGSLRLLDTCGYIGPAAFDAARWAARTGGPTEARNVLNAWLTVETDLDATLAHSLLGLELLMEAGVREIIKREKSLPLRFPDACTVQLLAAAGQLLN